MKGFEERTDAELAAAAQSGDVLAEGALVKRYASLAEGISRSYFIVGGDRDDLYQIALIALLEAVRRFDPEREAKFPTYVSACIRNRLLDAVRAASAGKNAPLRDSVPIDGEDEGAASELVSPELSPEQQYIEKEAEESFFSALGEMLGEQDLTVLRFYLAGVPYKEIAEKLGISAKKVDNTVYGAKKKIARLIEEHRKP